MNIPYSKRGPYHRADDGAKALMAFPAGFGTLDELFETLTLVQPKKIKPNPTLLSGKAFWQRAIHFDTLVEEETISPQDLTIFQYGDTAEEAWEKIRASNHIK